MSSSPRPSARHGDPDAAHDVIVVGASGDPGIDDTALELGTRFFAKPIIVKFDRYCSTDNWNAERERVCAQIMTLARTSDDVRVCILSRHIAPERLTSLVRSISFVSRPIHVITDSETSFDLRRPMVATGANLRVENQGNPLDWGQRAAKRLMDVVLASGLVIVLSPLLVLIAAAIKFDSPGPILFQQMRSGLGGKPFKIFKFRTMSVLEDGDTIVQAQREDSRVTRLGKWLRMMSLDELPQLYNVLAGQMSLVGPRPHALAHDEQFAMLVANYALRQHVMPGITGWAQVHGLRGETATVELMRRRIEYDLWYALHAGLLLDLRILGLTVLEAFRGRNAY